MIYLDNAAATRPLQVAKDEMNYVLSVAYGNPNSSHRSGSEARKILDASEAKIRACIGAKSGKLYFFPTSTAAAQTAIYGACAVGYATIRYDTEHHSIGDHTYIQSDVCANRKANGHFLHCRMLANNETGEIYPVPKLPGGDLWLCDATAALGHIPVRVEQLGCTYLIGDALKFGGIPGAAFLWVKSGAPFYPLIEGGTPSVALACAMAAALEWQTEHMDENTRHIETIRDCFLEKVVEIPDMWVNGREFPDEHQMAYITNVSFDGVYGDALAMLCSKRGVMISAGAACTSGNNNPSHVIMAMFRDEQRARSAVRISFSHETTQQEAEQAAKIIAECVEGLRSISC